MGKIVGRYNNQSTYLLSQDTVRERVMGYFKKTEKTEFAAIMKSWTLSDTVDAMAKGKPTLSDIVDANCKGKKAPQPFNAPKIK